MTPWTVAYQAPQSMEFSRQEYWSGLPFPSPEDLPNPGIKPGSPALQADALPSEPPGKPFCSTKDTTKRWKIKLQEIHLNKDLLSVQFSSVQLLSRVWLFATPWIAVHQASLSITNSQSSLRLMSIESVMPSSHLILCRPLFLLPPIPPSIRVF